MFSTPGYSLHSQMIVSYGEAHHSAFSTQPQPRKGIRPGVRERPREPRSVPGRTCRTGRLSSDVRWASGARGEVATLVAKCSVILLGGRIAWLEPAPVIDGHPSSDGTAVSDLGRTGPIQSSPLPRWALFIKRVIPIKITAATNATMTEPITFPWWERRFRAAGWTDLR